MTTYSWNCKTVDAYPTYSGETDDSFNVGGTFSVKTGNSSTTITSWSNSDTDIDGLLPGSAFGSLIKGATNGHIVIGLQENDDNDTFSILSGGGNYMSDTTYDTLAFQVKPSGNTVVGGDLTVGGGDITLSGTGRIQGVDTVTDGTDAANKTYVDNAVTGLTEYVAVAGDTMTGDLQIPEYLYHAGDTNTYLRFLTDQLQLAAGGRNVISMDEGTDPDIVVLGDSTTTTWTDGKLGVGTSTPQRDVEFIGPGNDYLSLGVAQISVGQFTGIHFGYRENNNLYRKSAKANR